MSKSIDAVRRSAFTLVELLVVIGIIALLISVLLPALSAVRREGSRIKCLSNMRNMEMAQSFYTNDHRGELIQAGFGHKGEPSNEQAAWFNTLQTYYQNRLVPRCPSDNSPFWPDGDFVPYSNPPRYRQTSYAINDFVAGGVYCPWGPGRVTPCPPNLLYTKISRIPRPSATIQFVELTYTGEFAGSDHCHVENWVGSNLPANASKNLQINAHGGRPKLKESRANYAFLDGHVATLPFGDVFTNLDTKNSFDPYFAQ